MEKNEEIENLDMEIVISEQKHAVIEKVLFYMKQNGLNQSQFASKVGMKQQQISRFIKGESDFQFSTVLKLLYYIGADLGIVNKSKSDDYYGGLKSVEYGEMTLYYNEAMLKEGAVIVEEYGMDSKDMPCNDISVYFHIGTNAGIYQITMGTYLEKIQTYRIICDLSDMYSRNSFGRFIKTMHEISGSYQDSDMQSKAENKKDLYESYSKRFKQFKAICQHNANK